MKKVIVLMLALFLAIPAITYAGSVTSRYDVTIGGFVKFDVGWGSQGQGADYWNAAAGSINNNANVVDKYSSSFMAAGETKLNFLVKGPDAWGAKTSAFIEGDFRGGGGNAYEGFNLRHAFMTFDWADSKLLIGQTWQVWGLMPSFSVLGFNELGAMNKGTRLPQIMFTQTFAKNWSLSTGFVSAFDPRGSTGADRTATGINNGAVTSEATIFSFPNFEAEFGYKSDACGKIGPWGLQAALSGFIGQNKMARRQGVAGTEWDDSDVTNWGLAFKAYVPIIPEKKGNKTGALGFTGSTFAAAGPNAYFGPYLVDAYISDVAGATQSITARNASVYGGWAELTYYLTDQLSANAIYGYTKYNFSTAIMGQTLVGVAAVNGYNVTTTQNVQTSIFNLMYDVNPAIRLGAQYTHMSTGYTQVQAAGALTGGGKSGSMDIIRAAAWYFF